MYMYKRIVTYIPTYRGRESERRERERERETERGSEREKRESERERERERARGRESEREQRERERPRERRAAPCDCRSATLNHGIRGIRRIIYEQSPAPNSSSPELHSKLPRLYAAGLDGSISGREQCRSPRTRAARPPPPRAQCRLLCEVLKCSESGAVMPCHLRN